MKSNYHIDPSQISLQQLKTHLMGRDLIPSRKPLLVDLEENLSALERIGITALDSLIAELKKKDKLKEVSQTTGISEEYLILLRREANSYFPKPVPLHKFPGTSPELVQQLASQGIQNSQHLYLRTAGGSDLSGLASEQEISLERLTRLSGLADLARAYGVGPVFADLLFNGGIHSLEEFLTHTPEQVINLYQKETGKKADFSLADLEFSQAVAGLLFSSK